jgi:thiol-disulfide isomerase/thioredoxin
MKKYIYFLFIVFPSFVLGQDIGIHFESGLTWKEIVNKAKLENKFIFLDCYATWCGPCKAMDKFVYSLPEVGAIVNKKFIAIKVQMDTTIQDSNEIKQWYIDAHNIMNKYKVAAYPTFLFISPNGNLVHRGQGYKFKGDFIKLLENAIDSTKQVYTLLEQQTNGKKDYKSILYLVKSLRELKEKEAAIALARDYLDNYLYKLEDNDLLVVENIKFIASYILSSTERGFNIFYKHGKKVDSLVGKKGYSQAIVDWLIIKDEIFARLKFNNIYVNRPNWRRLSKIISRKFDGQYAMRTILDAKIRWYSEKKDWKLLAKYNVQKIVRYGMDTTDMGRVNTNNMIWDVIFEHSSNKKILNMAIFWMNRIVEIDPYYTPALDTYANLLYKVGRIKEAIQVELKAIKQEEKNALKLKIKPNSMFIETLQKMKKGEPTWKN